MTNWWPSKLMIEKQMVNASVLRNAKQTCSYRYDLNIIIIIIRVLETYTMAETPDW